MLHLIDTPDQVQNYHRQLQARLRALLPNTRPFVIGHLGANYSVDIFTDGDLWYCGMLAEPSQPNRYWNAFGLFTLSQPSNIVVEINVPLKGRDRRIAGALALDTSTGQLCILHRGKVGGGRKAVGQKNFIKWHKRTAASSWKNLDEGRGEISQVILIGQVDKEDFLINLKSFVRIVNEFKESVAHSGEYPLI